MFNPIADFMAMRREIHSRSRLLGVWGFLLNVPPLIGGVIHLNTSHGVAVVLGILVSLLIATQINNRLPMSRLMAVCHIVFVPALYLLARDVVWHLPGTFREGWMMYSLVLMSICVLIDLIDLFRYFALGNRTYVHG